MEFRGTLNSTVFHLSPVGHDTRVMTDLEWLVRLESQTKFQRVIASDFEQVICWLEPKTEAMIFSSDGRTFRLRNGHLLEVRTRKLNGVTFAWWCARHSQAARGARTVIGMLLVSTVIARICGVPLQPVIQVGLGLFGVLAWWSWELQHSRLEPDIAWYYSFPNSGDNRQNTARHELLSEFLVQLYGSRKYVRLQARGLDEVLTSLGIACPCVVFTQDRNSYWLEPHEPPTPLQARLPITVWLAWLGVQHPRVRLAFQLAAWIFLAVALVLATFRVSSAPAFLILAGLINVLIWWWSEAAQSNRIEPGVRPTRAS